MTRLQLLAMVLLTFAAACSPTRDESPAGTSSEIHKWRALSFPRAAWKHDDVYFIDRNTGWAVVNTKGQIYKTEDGGESWALQFEPPERPFFRCIAFTDPGHGFACNLTAAKHDDPLYRTRDGGATWSAVPMDSKVEGFCGIAIVNAKTLYLTGRYPGPAYVAKSEDGGDHWSVTDLGEQLGRAVDIHFWNEREGLLLGGSAAPSTESRVVILGTSDGGKSWSERYRGPRDGEWGWKFSFPNARVGYASIDTEALEAVGTEYFLKTEDGGQTWQRRPFFEGQYRAQGIGFATADTGWIGSFLEQRPTLKTGDGGDTWTPADFGDRINRFRFVDGAGFAAGHQLYRMDVIEPPQ